MKEIQLTQGKFALVDDEDYEWLNQWKWNACSYGKTFYVSRIDKSTGVNKKVYMHRLILGLTEKVILSDHKDRNGLNNQRDNLRASSRAENAMNMGIRSGGTSGVKGVCFDKSKGKYMAHITVNYKFKFLGYFTDIESATEARRIAKEMFFGEFANAV